MLSLKRTLGIGREVVAAVSPELAGPRVFDLSRRELQSLELGPSADPKPVVEGIRQTRRTALESLTDSGWNSLPSIPRNIVPEQGGEWFDAIYSPIATLRLALEKEDRFFPRFYLAQYSRQPGDFFGFTSYPGNGNVNAYVKMGIIQGLGWQEAGGVTYLRVNLEESPARFGIIQVAPLLEHRGFTFKGI